MITTKQTTSTMNPAHEKNVSYTRFPVIEKVRISGSPTAEPAMFGVALRIANVVAMADKTQWYAEQRWSLCNDRGY
jgi:hypothetical protein